MYLNYLGPGSSFFPFWITSRCSAGSDCSSSGLGISQPFFPQGTPSWVVQCLQYLLFTDMEGNTFLGLYNLQSTFYTQSLGIFIGSSQMIQLDGQIKKTHVSQIPHSGFCLFLMFSRNTCLVSPPIFWILGEGVKITWFIISPITQHCHTYFTLRIE